MLKKNLIDLAHHVACGIRKESVPVTTFGSKRQINGWLAVLALERRSPKTTVTTLSFFSRTPTDLKVYPESYTLQASLIWGQSRNFPEGGPVLPKTKAALINKKMIPIPVGYLSKCHWVSGLGIHKLGHSIHPGDLKHLQHLGFTRNQLTQNSALTISHVLLISCLNKESPKPSLALYTRTS